MRDGATLSSFINEKEHNTMESSSSNQELGTGNPEVSEDQATTLATGLIVLATRNKTE